MKELPKEPLKHQLFINGKYVDSKNGEKFTRENPAHNVIIGKYALRE